VRFLTHLVLLCAAVTHAFAQATHTFETTSEIVWAGVDRPGDLFLVLKTGEVVKYNKDGQKIGVHGFQSPPTLIDPLDGVQSFYFDEAGTDYGNLSADMTSASRHVVDPAFAVRPWLVCPSLHELWILDSADFSIKKTKMKSSAISLENVLIHLPSKQIEDYIYMREYQNYLFLLDKNAGIHIYNSLGKFVKTVGEKDITYFSFFGEEIYYLKNKQLYLTDLYTNEKRTLQVPIACRFALLRDDYLYAVEGNKVTVFAFKP
jgi:hypothetical protein